MRDRTRRPGTASDKSRRAHADVCGHEDQAGSLSELVHDCPPLRGGSAPWTYAATTAAPRRWDWEDKAGATVSPAMSLDALGVMFDENDATGRVVLVSCEDEAAQALEMVAATVAP
eukprot:s744_g28.t1